MNNAFYAVVTARAGSSLAGKNYREINGHPLFIWSVIAGLNCHYVDKVIVSSNDPEVWKITTEHISLRKQFLGENELDRLVLCPRPDDISGPLSKNEDAMIHAIKNEGLPIPAYTILLQPTSPVRNNGLLDKCCEAFLYEDGKYNV